MKTKFRFAAAIMLILLAITSLIACSDSTVTAIAIRENSFTSAYAVDSALSLEGAFLVVTLSNGKTEEVQITPEMVTGFDSSTTGEKSFTVSYGGQVTEAVNYVVYNAENASKDVITKTRLVVCSGITSEYAEYSISLNNIDVNNVKAVSFSMESTADMNIESDNANITAITEQDGWAYSVKRISATKINVVYYNNSGSPINGNGNLIKLRVAGGKNGSVKLTNITISDGQKDYYLPVASTEGI